MEKLLVSIAAALMSVSTHAEIVTIDPDNYPAGTELSVIAPGVNLRTITHAGGSTYTPVYSPVLSHDCTSPTYCGAFEGVRDLGSTLSAGVLTGNWGAINDWDGCANGGSSFACMSPSRVLELRFKTPISLLQLETSWLSDPSAIIAYDSAGNELFRCSSSYYPCSYDSTVTYGSGSYSETRFVVTRRTADISRVVFGAIGGMARIGEISFWRP
jgi:hypothetical protein